MANWVINPELEMVSVLAEYGRFLENDYRMIIEHLEIPKVFQEYAETTERKFVIVGGKETPWMLAKSVFLCLKLAGAESVVVTTPYIDESFMVQNVLDNYSNGIRTKLFTSASEELFVNMEWRDEIDKSTDIVVFGDTKAMESFRDYETVDRHVWEHGENFSFGIVREEHLTATVINQICFDFFSFYGQGSLSPKFYFVLGRLKKSIIKQFSTNMQSLYATLVNEYREKLEITRKSDLVSTMLNANYAAKYVQVGSLHSDVLRGNLYGEVCLVPVNNLDDIQDFIDKWRDRISTVAINNNDDPDILDFLEDNLILRVCDVGDMQFPDFFEQYHGVDDYIVYVKMSEEIDEDYEDPFNW
jgi:hypothetical protein